MRKRNEKKQRLSHNMMLLSENEGSQGYLTTTEFIH